MVLRFRLVGDGEGNNFGKVYPEFKVFALGEYAEGEEVSTHPIHELVGLREEDLKPVVRDTLGSLRDTDVDEAITELSKVIHGYYQFQDILDVTLEPGLPIFNRHYCYYESLVYLRSSAISWLDGNILAATTLLRPFIELTILHLYWYSRSKAEGYGRYYDWLAGKRGKAPFKDQVNYIFDNLSVRSCFGETELEVVQNNIFDLYKWGCIYNHTPKIEESMFHVAGGTGGSDSDFQTSLSYYPFITVPLLKEVICTFMLTYPMSFFPVDRYAKWGFEGPAGVFVDRTDVLILKKALGQNRFDYIKSKVAESSEVKEKMELYEKQPVLSAEELDLSWKGFQEVYRAGDSAAEDAVPGPDTSTNDSLGLRISKAKSLTRVHGWLINYWEDPPSVESLDEPL